VVNVRVGRVKVEGFIITSLGSYAFKEESFKVVEGSIFTIISKKLLEFL
jgi:hypothetical protein